MPEYPSAADVQRLAAAIEGLSERLDRQATDSADLIRRLDRLRDASGVLSQELRRIRHAMQPRGAGGASTAAGVRPWLDMIARGLDRLSRGT